MKDILLVEDTLHLGEEIADMLQREGYQVTLVQNAVHALKILNVSRMDLIITDLLMPVMDGFELIEVVRSTTSLRSIPIIVLSAKELHADKMGSGEIGADAFIQKPCKAHELTSTINHLLSR